MDELYHEVEKDIKFTVKELGSDTLCISANRYNWDGSSSDFPFEMNIVVYARPKSIGDKYKRKLNKKVVEQFEKECGKTLEFVHDYLLHKFGLLNDKEDVKKVLKNDRRPRLTLGMYE